MIRYQACSIGHHVLLKYHWSSSTSPAQFFEGRLKFNRYHIRGYSGSLWSIKSFYIIIGIPRLLGFVILHQLRSAHQTHVLCMSTSVSMGSHEWQLPRSALSLKLSLFSSIFSQRTLYSSFPAMLTQAWIVTLAWSLKRNKKCGRTQTAFWVREKCKKFTFTFVLFVSLLCPSNSLFLLSGNENNGQVTWLLRF